MWLLCLGFVSQMVGVVMFCIGGGVVVGGLASDGGPMQRLLLSMRLLRSAFMSQMVGVVVLWRVVFSHWVSGCVWVLGCVARGSEGLSEQVGSEGGTSGIHGKSPLVCSCSPVIIWHISHPSFEGRRVVVVGLPSGCHLACWGAAQPQKVSRNEIEIY
jgi:hypothetical protein